MKKKQLFWLVLVLGLMLTLAACGNNDGDGTTTPSDDMPSFTLRAALMLADDHPHAVAAKTVLLPRIAELTDGHVTIELYTNGALGSDREATEACQLGSIEMSLPGTATISTLDPSWFVLDVPYVFTSVEGCRNALDGEMGDLMNQSLEEKTGLVNLGFGESGMRNLSSNKQPITHPDNLKGLKIRVQENPYQIASFQALGCNPTPMAFGELYTALQQNQVDGQDNSIIITYTNKFYEVQKYYTISQQHFNAKCNLINADVFYSMPEEYQQALRQACQEMVVEQRRLVDEYETTWLAEMEAAGLQVYVLTPEEKVPFIEVTQSVRDQFVEEFGDVGQQMLDLAAQYQ